MNRIEERFKKLRSENKKAFIPYICAGDQTLDITENLVYTLEESGVDVLELGIPFSDPLADGPVIQEASLRSINGGFKIDNFFETVRKIRKKSELPLACMVYYSTVFGYGKEKFIGLCAETGIDGLIIPDLPYEEYDEIDDVLKKTDICLIPLVAVTSGNRVERLVKNSRGFVYCVSSLGVTGERKSFDKSIDNLIDTVKKYTDTPACVGFGISKREDVERFEKVADGVIVGSAIVRKIFDSKCNYEEVKKFVKGLKGC